MAATPFTFDSSALPTGSVLVGFRGQEALSQPYRFDVFVTAADAAALEDMVGATASITISRDGQRKLHGVIAEVSLLEEQTERSIAQLTMVPTLSLLGLSRHSRIFTDTSVPDIIEQVLQSGGIGSDGYELRLDGDYQPEPHVCQYKESDLAFVSRLMEHEGIYYFFEHGDDSAKLVLRNGPLSASLGSGKAAFRPDGDDDRLAGSALFSFRKRHAARPAKVSLADYSHESPSLAVSGSADVFDGGSASVVVHADDNFAAPARGKALAEVRAAELMASQAVVRAAGRHFNLQPGFVFELEEHFVNSLNRRYLCVSAAHTAVVSTGSAELASLTGLPHDEVYDVEVTAIDAELTFRPARLTPRPRVHGLEIALVDGPADSDYAQLDGQGRYRLRFSFDENDLEEGQASTAIRMMQPHAGNPEGMHFPLRKGTEVMVAFLNGDPDRPIIAGAVPNTVTPSPVTAANHTHNVIHTGGNNRIDMEDLDGSQWIHVSTPTKNTHMHLGRPVDPWSHHFELKTDGNCLYNFGSNQDILVGAKLTEDVKGAVTETYQASQKSSVTGPKQTTVTKDGCVETYSNTQMTWVKSDVVETYAAGHDTTVSKAARDEFFTAGQDTTVNAKLTDQDFHSSHMRMVDEAAANTHIGKLERHVSGNVFLRYSEVSRLFGPTLRSHKSLYWKTKVTSITSASQNIKAPKGFWSKLASKKYTGFSLYAGLLHLWMGTYRTQTSGVWAAATVGKAEGFGAFFNLRALWVTNIPAHIGHAGFVWDPTFFKTVF